MLKEVSLIIVSFILLVAILRSISFHPRNLSRQSIEERYKGKIVSKLPEPTVTKEEIENLKYKKDAKPCSELEPR